MSVLGGTQVSDNIVKPDQYWGQPPDSLAAVLHSTLDGLSSDDAGQCLEQFGPNVLQAREWMQCWSCTSVINYLC
jgi:hypothetical protein